MRTNLFRYFDFDLDETPGKIFFKAGQMYITVDVKAVKFEVNMFGIIQKLMWVEITYF